MGPFSEPHLYALPRQREQTDRKQAVSASSGRHEFKPQGFRQPLAATDSDRSKHNEYAWFQDYLTVSAYPVEADPNNPNWFW